MPQPARRGPGRPPAAKAADTRKRILRAAREVFSERGYDAATFQAIAIRADLTRPAINHYFPSKSALYRELLEQTTDLIVGAGLERAGSETTLMGRLSAFITAAVQADPDNQSASAFLVTCLQESQRHPELSRIENPSLRVAREFLTQVVHDAIERGELTPDTDVSLLAETLLVVLCGVGFYAGFVGSPEDMGPIVERLQQVLAGTLVRTKSSRASRRSSRSDVAHNSV